MPKIKRVFVAKRVDMLNYSKRLARRKKKVYNPATDTNWCHLPMEIRIKCIESMDLKTRKSLRCTSRTEKSLVDSKRCDFDYLKIWCRDKALTIVGKNRIVGKRSKHEMIVFRSKSRRKKLRCALNVLKSCETACFQFSHIYDRNQPEPLKIDDIPVSGPFRFRKFITDLPNPELINFFIENSETLEKLSIQNTDADFPMQDVLDLQAVIRVKELRITRCRELTPLWGLIEKWIEIDAPIGKSLQFVTYNRITVASFIAIFAERILQESTNQVRFRMNDASKQILLRQLRSDGLSDNYVSLKVIPVDLAEEDYGKGDEWMTTLFEANLAGKYMVDYDSDDAESAYESSEASESSSESDF